MIDQITISEGIMARPISAGSMERKGTPQGWKVVEKPPDPSESPQASEIVAERKHEMIGDNCLQFNVHDDTGRVVVTVVEELTGQAIREIPPSEVLKLAASFVKTHRIEFDQKE